MDSDAVAACENKLKQFRIKELKDVLTFAGVSKQGKKQDLLDRLLALLYDEGTPGLFKKSTNGKEGLVEFIDDAYRKMQDGGASDSSAKKQNGTGSSRIHPKEETEELSTLERKIRCPCGSDMPGVGQLIQCVDPDCNVWQHSSCVIIPEKPMEKISSPTRFFCEACRVKRADPFWATMAHPLYPIKLSCTIPIDGTNPIQTMEKTFKITRADRDLLQKTEYDIQAWCMLLNDSVPFRVQWPQYADLQVNGIPVRTVHRPASQLLGANGRDDGAKITLYIAEGVNKISLSGSDARTFCLGVRLVKRRTLQQVLGMIPKEPDGEPFECALARVQRCIGGGITMGDNDSDSDLEVIADSVPVNLRCPMSGSRMKTAGRFRPCAHMGCFDLNAFVELNERSRKWQCPICLRNYSLEDVIIDPFFNRILNKMQSCGEEINEIDMKPDGSWRVKNAREIGDLAQWHHPDGSIISLSISEIGGGNSLECNASKVGIQNNMVGSHVDGHPGMHHSFIGQQDNEVNDCEQNIITMSSTTTGNTKDDDPFSAFNSDENEVTSGLINLQGPSVPDASADVIILSDSDDDDDVSLVRPTTLPLDGCTNYDGYSLSAPAKILCGDPCIFNGNNYDFLNPQSLLPSDSQGGSGIDFFGTSGARVDEQNSASCSEPVNQLLTSESSLNPVNQVIDSFDPPSSFENQFASLSGNISLDVLLPSPSDPQNEHLVSSNSPGEDWISLKTGDAVQEGTRSSLEVHLVSAVENVPNLQNQCSSKDGVNSDLNGASLPSEARADENVPDLRNQYRSNEDSLTETTPIASGSGSDMTVNKLSGFPFAFPRQRRTMRKRPHEVAFRDRVPKKNLLQ